MKRIVILFTLLMGVAVGFAQSGVEVLRKVSDNFSKMGAYRIDFELEMASATNTSKGHCLIDAPLYLIVIDGMKQGFDGEKMWMVDVITQEVVYDAHNPQSHSLFVNPTLAFDFSEELFGVVAQEESDGVLTMTLEPKEGVLDGIAYVTLSVDEKTLLPTRLGYDMEGAEIFINILSIEPQDLSPEAFASEVPQGFEVIDFR
jgi:outer membrane lipoprotein-sorting protein